MPPFAESQEQDPIIMAGYDDDNSSITDDIRFFHKPKQHGNTNDNHDVTTKKETSKVVLSFYDVLMDFNLCCSALHDDETVVTGSRSKTSYEQVAYSLPNENGNKIQEEENKEEVLYGISSKQEYSPKRNNRKLNLSNKMPPFAECQDRYDDSFFLTKPKPKSNDYDIMTNESIAATDVSVTSKVSSFYEKLMDFNLCCTHDQAEISLNNNMEQSANDDDEQTHQLVKTISMDILMKKAEEADRHNKVVAERYESTSEKSVSVDGASDDDEGTISTKDNSQHEAKKLIISKNLEKKTTDQSKSLRKNLETESMTGKKPSLFVRGKEFVLVKKKNNKNKGTNKLSTKKKRWSTKYTKKLLPMKKTEVVVISECDGMLLNGKQKSSTMMKRIKKSMSFPKIKNNRTKNDVSSDDKKKASKVKRIIKSMPFPKIKSNRTTINELPSNEKKKKSSMVKRIKKSMAFKKDNSNRTMNSTNLSSSNQKKKKSSMVKRIKKSMSFKKVNNNRTMSSINLSSSNKKKKKSSMVKSIKKSLSLKKVKSIHKRKNEASLPAIKMKKKTSSMMMKNGKKSFSFNKKISKDKCQDDADCAGSSSFEE